MVLESGKEMDEDLNISSKNKWWRAII